MNEINSKTYNSNHLISFKDIEDESASALEGHGESAAETQPHAETGEEAGAHGGGHTVQLAPEKVMILNGFTVTNTMTASLFSFVLILIFAILVRAKAGVIPSRLQVLFEAIFVYFLDLFERSVGKKKARQLVPIAVTFFMFLLISNQFILLPFLGSFFTEHGPLFRTPTTDYSLTIAMGIMVVVFSHVIAFIASPFGHLGTYFRINGLIDIIKGKKPLSTFVESGIDFGLGLLEIISDMAKIISLATRLFGNIFSGEVVIIIVSGLMFFTQYFIPIPFIILASFAALIQAFVFSLLTVLSISNNLAHATHKH